jgi:hypothetical protein
MTEEVFSKAKSGQIVKRAGKIAALIVMVMLPLLIVPQYIYDPLGLWIWDDAYQISSRIRCGSEDCSLYMLPEGESTFKSGWTATTNRDGTRVTPSNSPYCTVRIALIGDSFTWGPFVSDSETWANLLAERFPLVCFDNHGQWGYNAEQVAQTLEQQVTDDSDYVIYFIFTNDDMPPGSYPTVESPPHPLISLRYARAISWELGWRGREEERGEIPPKDRDTFGAAIQTMAADPRVHFVGFEQEILVHVVRDMGLDVYGIPLPSETEMVAPVDNHINALGHNNIARSLYPLIEYLLES